MYEELDKRLKDFFSYPDLEIERLLLVDNRKRLRGYYESKKLSEENVSQV